MRPSELEIKLHRIRVFLKKKKLQGLLLSNRANFSWLSCGGQNHVMTDTDQGVASLWVTSSRIELWTNEIEEARFKEEETLKMPFIYRSHPWWREEKRSWILGKRVGSDDGAWGTLNLSEEIIDLRSPLTMEEKERYRKLGHEVGQSLEEVADQVKRGWSEQRVTSELSRALLRRGIQPDLLLAGADHRIERFRHPLATAQRIRQKVMIVICARRGGLIVSLTRLLHFGKLSVELERKHEACLHVEEAMWKATRPGVEARSIFQEAMTEYIRQGYPGEWNKHHQGGPTGYGVRDYLATPLEKRKIILDQAVAWNPSITGTKTEDTALVTKKGLEVLTVTPHWPMVEIFDGGRKVLRPAIRVKK